MFWLFTLHNISPIDVHRMTRNERKILFAFQRYEIKKRDEKQKEEDEHLKALIEKMQAGR